MERNYTLLHGKVNVIAIAITKSADLNSKYTNKLKSKSEKDSQVFEKMEEFLSSIKESILKVNLSHQSIVSQESFSQLSSNIESNIKSELAPILELALHF